MAPGSLSFSLFNFITFYSVCSLLCTCFLYLVFGRCLDCLITYKILVFLITIMGSCIITIPNIMFAVHWSLSLRKMTIDFDTSFLWFYHCFFRIPQLKNKTYINANTQNKNMIFCKKTQIMHHDLGKGIHVLSTKKYIWLSQWFTFTLNWHVICIVFVLNGCGHIVVPVFTIGSNLLSERKW